MRILGRFTKRVMTGLLVAVILVLSFSGCSSYEGDSTLAMEKLNIAAQLSENGDMKVTELWKVDLHDRNRAYRNLYRSFELDSAKAGGITDVSITDEDSKTKYRYLGDIDPESDPDAVPDNSSYSHLSGNILEIGWFMPAIDEGARTFTVSYTVKDIVAVHKDTAVLYNFFIPKNFSIPITELNASIQFPSGGKQSAVRAWLHTTTKSGLTIDSANRVSFYAKEIPADTPVEVRLCMPPQLFPASARTDTQTVLPQITTEEQKWATAYEQKLEQQYRLGIFDAAGGLVLLLAGIAALIWIKRKNRRHKVDIPEYTREIPQGNSPGGIANLFYFYSGGVNEKVKERVFSSTLLSLARKGTISFSGSGDDFSVTMKTATKQLALTESEDIFLKMITAVAERFQGTFTMSQFRSYAETECHYIENTMNSFLSAAKREIAGRGYYEKRPGYLIAASAFGALSMVLAIFMLFGSHSAGSTLVYIPLSLLLTGILLLIAGASKQKLTVKGEQDLATWQGLKKYMLEFSRMTEYGVPQLALWEEYLVYATMMNISKSVCEQLKMVYPELNDETYVNTYFGNSYLFYMLGYQRGLSVFSPFGTDFGAALGSTISDISSAATRLANPPPSDNGGFGGFGSGGGFGGGGFGGGGGGFGGGGGGGAR